MAVDKSLIGTPTGKSKITVERGPVSNFAKALTDDNPIYQNPEAAKAAGFENIPAPPTWGFAMMWLALAAAITVRTALRNRPGGLPFALTWWSFTFPVGTCVTGTISLAARCHADVLRGASVLLFALLLVAWLVVAARTVSGAAAGRLFKPVAAISRALST